MKAISGYVILTRGVKEKKESIIILPEDQPEDFFEVSNGEGYEKGDKVVCFEFPELRTIDGKEYYFTKSDNICALV